MRWLAPVITRSPAQESACKGLERDGQAWAITSEATSSPLRS
ncbi:Malolactic regulator [Lacticaseibacillus rhamnosus]|uniref:Malolactic regulator n=1 Tax=Lacticaseibacillus rhamnosus TaxID=47715 RepID=A0AAP8J0Q6_LACRH|nr:Malolactic regulator [Lacticaseibacillus rhamnosus]ONG01674.1 Malolactic regulator [Lacticaseibacillus rhamnosus]PLA58086.1 Malolactic regulator [Lacticaseibacillus rhamnosus]PTM22038.1 Malolactic regulator [Lacticaseibacillus rhamnosus]RXS55298.1 Malolactic regulator [Lacticaseibacillus rhamnosus]